MIESANLFNRFLKKFQSQKVLIHEMYDHLRNLVLLIASKICKNVELEMESDIFRFDNLLPANEISLPKNITDRIQTLSENYPNIESEFRTLYYTYFLVAGKYLLSQVNWDKIKLFEILSPMYLYNEPIPVTIHLDKLMKYFLNDKDMNINSLRDEYQLFKIAMKSSKREDVMTVSDNIGLYWHKILTLNTEKYSNLSIFIRSLLSTSHGQSDVERGFSSSSLILTEHRTRMSIQTLNARINTIDAIKNVNKALRKFQLIGS